LNCIGPEKRQTAGERSQRQGVGLMTDKQARKAGSGEKR